MADLLSLSCIFCGGAQRRGGVIMPRAVRIRIIVAVVVALVVALGVRPSMAQNVVLMVNGEPVTSLDIEQYIKYGAQLQQKSLSRQDAINEIIDDKVKVKEGKKYGVDPTFANVEEMFGDWATQRKMTPDQAAKALESRGIRPETLKIRLKAEQVWTSLVRGRFKSELDVSDRELAQAIERGGGGSGQVEGYEYKLQQVVLLVPRGSSEGYIQSRHKEAESYRARIQTCEEANALFRSTPNATIGEVMTKTSADFPDVVASLRKILDTTPVGHLTPPDVITQGISMFALCSRIQTKTDTPQKRVLRNKLITEKYQRISNKYLRELRNAAMIEKR